MTVRKLLVIRLSSIGDIVLTTPVLRALRRAHPQAQIHYLVKARFADAIRHNPHIDKLHLYDGSLRTCLQALRAEGFDYVVDLHGNWRSFLIRTELAVPASVFPKCNLAKLRMTLLKQRISVPHIVDRYMQAALPIGALPDEAGLDFDCPAPLDDWAQTQLHAAFGSVQPWALCLSASYATKRWLPEYYHEYLQQYTAPCVLLGGPAERELAAQILQGIPPAQVYNAVGNTSLLQSAALLKHCRHIITPDTGMMHIAAALQVPAITLWGNTVPAFGMDSYRSPAIIVEQTGLGCRPCSKLGHHTCPKGHFRCMHALTPQRVLEAQGRLGTRNPDSIMKNSSRDRV